MRINVKETKIRNITEKKRREMHNSRLLVTQAEIEKNLQIETRRDGHIIILSLFRKSKTKNKRKKWR